MLRFRLAKAKDAPAILKLGRDPVFDHDGLIRYYDASHLAAWFRETANNVWMVAETERGKVAGFAFCKIISKGWAMLDTLYVAPAQRDGEVGARFLEAIKKRLRARGIVYLSTLIEVDRQDLQKKAREQGFDRNKRYDWFSQLLIEE
jgi:N-acetylglutamate synthase-like GNAT family acetyltransferase